MDDERRQQLSLRAITVTARSAMAGLSREQAERTLERASALLDQARREATSPALLRDIEAVQRELDQQFESEAEQTSS